MRFILLVLLFCSCAYSTDFAAGYGKLNFSISKAGSYSLYSLGKAQDGEVLKTNGDKATLHNLYNDKVVLLGFVYLSCGDVNGCPLTTFIISQLKAEIEQINSLRNNVHLLSLSFDPQRDTPKVLKKYSHHIGANGENWSLVTTRDQYSLKSILKKYNQPIQKIYDKNGKETGRINHILRVFLIDKNKEIRNIYTNSFLHKDIVISDIKTLLLEEYPNMKFDKISKPKKHINPSHYGMH